MPKVKRKKRAPTATVRDMSRYEEAVDKLVETVESIKIAQDEFDTQIEDDLRALTDTIRFEFQMM